MNDLANTDFRGATVERLSLVRRSFRGADLTRTLFVNCDLRDADFSGATGVLPVSFPGCDLCGATLPQSVNFSPALETVQGAVKYAQTVFMLSVFASAYCLLTVGATSDTDLIVNSASTPLPIIDTPVAIAAFYALAPVLLLASVIWLHAYLQRAWATLARLPMRFPDGLRLSERIDQWIPLSVGIGSSSRRYRTFSKLEAVLSSAVLYLVVPGTMLAMWARHLPRHDLPVSLWQIAVLAFGMGFSAVFAFRARRTIIRTATARAQIVRETAGAALIASLVVIVLLPITLAVAEEAGDGPLGGHAPRIVRLADALGLPHHLNISGANVATRPPNWTRAIGGESLGAALASIGEVKLNGRNLDRAVADSAFLARARFDGASMRSLIAPLATFVQASFQGADLEGAKLSFSDLRDADFTGATLRDADLKSANLRGACFSGAAVMEARFDAADLRGADLAGSYGLTAEQLSTALCDANTRLPFQLSLEQCGSALVKQEGTDSFDSAASFSVSREDSSFVPEGCS